MKQENLDELKNIYLGLVTGGEGPEVLSEAPTSGVYEAKKKLDPVGQEDDDIDNDGDTDKSDKYLLNRRKVRSKAIGEATAMSKRGLDEPAVKAKQDARGAQRGRAALTPNERKQLNMEYDLYDLIQSHLLEYGFADTEEGANMIIENMSPSWIKQILSED